MTIHTRKRTCLGMNRLIVPSLALLLMAAAAPALAQAPRLVPDRDVTVDYQVEPREAPRQEVRVSIAAGGRRLRISAQDLPATFLIDRETAMATILVPFLKSYTSTSIAHYDLEDTVLRGARFSRLGSEVIAGLPCTDWSAVSDRGHAEGCITRDGVILKGEASDRHGLVGRVMASTVAYGGLDRTAFELPEGYNFVGNLPPGLLGARN